MKKIPTMFKRNPADMRNLLNEQNEDCAWVFAGEGVATRKYDGTCCLVKEGVLYKRRECKNGKPIPPDFIKVDYDPVTGKTVGWVPVREDDKADRWHVEAFNPKLKDGTYELVGPKVQGNPERMEFHFLQSHSEATVFSDVPRDFGGIKNWLSERDIEGIVFHHPDGRMAKIKKRDFGQKRIPKEGGAR